MKQLRFYHAKAQNLLCFGEEGVEFYFTDRGNIISIKGINIDAPGSDTEPASNASGKSSVQEILSVALYGKTIKEPTDLKLPDLVNNKTEGDMVAEVRFDDYKVIRTIKRSGTHKIDIWKSADHIWDKNSKLDLPGTTRPQQEIDKAIGLSHATFCNVIVFDDSDKYAFLEADAKTKREIIENLLGLERYREYCENAKAVLKAKKEDLSKVTKEYDKLKDELTACESRIAKNKLLEQNWKTGKELEVSKLELEISKHQNELQNTDVGVALSKYQQAQEQIVSLQNSTALKEEQIKKLEKSIADAQKLLESAKETRQGLQLDIQTLFSRKQELELLRKNSQDLILKLKNLSPGAECPTCHGVINRENYAEVLTLEEQKSLDLLIKIDGEAATIEATKEEFGKRSASITKVEQSVIDAKARLQGFQKALRDDGIKIKTLQAISKPESMDTITQVLEAKITEFRKQLRLKKEELEAGTPYQEILVDAAAEVTKKKQEIDGKSVEIKEIEGLIPYYEYWVKAFGDNGIRKFIIDGIIPALNSRINYWLQYLTENKIEVTFDNMLEATILENGFKVKYSGLSKSEKRRVNLGISQAFAYLMMVNCGTCPSLVFLDEITGGIDKFGVGGVYAMVIELAKERQVLVTTHDQTLLSYLQGCETIMLQKKDHVTTLLP